jgi:hypothetical protein
MTIPNPEIPPPKRYENPVDLAFITEALHNVYLAPPPEEEVEKMRQISMFLTDLDDNKRNLKYEDLLLKYFTKYNRERQTTKWAPPPPDTAPAVVAESEPEPEPELPLTPAAEYNNALAALMDEAEENEKAIHRLMGRRAILFNNIRTHVEDRTGAEIDPEVAPRVKPSGGWSPEVITRAELSSMLAYRMKITETMAGLYLHHGHMLADHLPQTLEALVEGEISYKHATVIVDQADTLPAEARGAFDAELAPTARDITAGTLTTKARHLREKMHPESIRDRHVKAKADRYVAVEPTKDGMAYLTVLLPAVEGIGIFNRIHDIADSVNCTTDPRTPGQIRADIARDLLLYGTHHQGFGEHIVPNVHLTVPALSMLGRSEEPAMLEGYGPIDPETARQWAGNDDSWVRILTHPETGAVLSVGRTKYKVPKAMRRYVHFQDQTCIFGPCGTPAEHCEIDHIHEWQDGGATEVQNLASLCRRHHKLKTYTGWSYEQLPGRIIRWTDPLGVQYLTEPVIPIAPTPVTPSDSAGDTAGATAGDITDDSDESTVNATADDTVDPEEAPLTPEEIAEVRPMKKVQVPDPKPREDQVDPRDRDDFISDAQRIREVMARHAQRKADAKAKADAEIKAEGQTPDDPDALPF